MSAESRPNVVLVVADQWRAKDTGYWGNPVIQTPHIDALAAAGAGCRWCFVQNPVSTPSRASMASGWYCHVNGHRTMHRMLRRHEPNLLRSFKDASDKGAAIFVLALFALVSFSLMLIANPLAGLAEIVLSAAALMILYSTSRKQFGGMSGDLSGWFLCLAEIMMVAGLAIFVKE